MINDADIEQAQWEQAGRDVANGVCPICEDMLDPMDPRWPDSTFCQTVDRYGKPLSRRSVYRLTRQDYARLVGPSHDGFHDLCLGDL